MKQKYNLGLLFNMENLTITLDLLNKYSSLILVLATVIYVGFTIVLAKETTKLREVETNPFISIHLDTFRSSRMLKLTIKNIGKAPAYNISFFMNEKYYQYFKYDFKNKISYFPPNQELTILTDYYEDFLKLEFENIPIKINYYSKEEKLIKDEYKLEWKYLSETILGTDNIEGIKKELEKVSKELRDLNKNIKNKEYVFSKKLRILEMEKDNSDIQFIFSNEYIGRIPIKDISNLRFTDIDKVEIIHGDLFDRVSKLKFTAEEIYSMFKKLDENNNIISR